MAKGKSRPNPNTALLRIYRIDKLLASGRSNLTAEKLAEELEAGTATISRDIDLMRAMGAPIEASREKKGFCYSDETYRLPAAFITAEDLLAVELVKALMELYRDTPVLDKVNRLLESVSAPVKGEENSKWYKDRIIVPKTITVPVDPIVWQSILTGLKENRVITFNYLKGNARITQKKYKAGKDDESKLTRRTVQPYQLMFDRTAWYLLAYDENKKAKRIFFVSRISKISVTERNFSLSRGFDYRSFNGNSYFGIFAGENIHKFEIEIFGDIHWITEIKIAEDQKIKETKTGAVISFTSNQFEKVLDWVLVQGAAARPLKPKALADRWKEVIKDMARLAAKV